RIIVSSPKRGGTSPPAGRTAARHSAPQSRATQERVHRQADDVLRGVAATERGVAPLVLVVVPVIDSFGPLLAVLALPLVIEDAAVHAIELEYRHDRHAGTCSTRHASATLVVSGDIRRPPR